MWDWTVLRRGIRDTVADACVGIAILSGTRGGYCWSPTPQAYIDVLTGEGMGLAFGAAELAGIALSANGPRTTTASGAGRRDGIPH